LLLFLVVAAISKELKTLFQICRIDMVPETGIGRSQVWSTVLVKHCILCIVVVNAILSFKSVFTPTHHQILRCVSFLKAIFDYLGAPHILIFFSISGIVFFGFIFLAGFLLLPFCTLHESLVGSHIASQLTRLVVFVQCVGSALDH